MKCITLFIALVFSFSFSHAQKANEKAVVKCNAGTLKELQSRYLNRDIVNAILNLKSLQKFAGTIKQLTEKENEAGAVEEIAPKKYNSIKMKLTAYLGKQKAVERNRIIHELNYWCGSNKEVLKAQKKNDVSGEEADDILYSLPESVHLFDKYISRGQDAGSLSTYQMTQLYWDFLNLLTSSGCEERNTVLGKFIAAMKKDR